MINNKDMKIKNNTGSLSGEQNKDLVFDKAYTSKYGYEFNPNDERWKLSKESPVSFNSLRKLTTPVLLHSIKKVLIHYAKEKQRDYVNNIIITLAFFFRTTGVKEVNKVSLMNFRSTLDEDTEYRLGTIVAFLKKWKKKGYPGITSDAIEYLSEQTIKGNKKGVAVQLLDAKEGPFSEMEMQTLHEKAAQGYRDGVINTEEYLSILLFANLGSRSMQLSNVKIKDLLKAKLRNGEDTFIIMIPRAKDGGGWREDLKAKPLNELIWNLAQIQAQDVIDMTKRLFNEIESDILQDLPLFPNWDYIEEQENSENLKDSLSEGLDVTHKGSQLFAKHTVRAIDKLDIISERTGEKLKANSKRFRYSVGTNLAKEGVGIYGIAEALDHVDIQNAGCYTRNSPEFVEKIDKAIGQKMIPLVQAFNGTLVDSERLAKNGDKRSKRIRFSDEEHNINLATCGEKSYCTEYAPIACYTCNLFQPWVDASHEVVLDFLIKERERIYSITNDVRITEVQDRTIHAVMDVIRKCSIRKEELKNQQKSLESVCE
ncbi:MAG: site-specific integrase [Methylococcales bacterium]